MLQLTSKAADPTAAARLAVEQARVTQSGTFDQQAEKAKARWDSKTSSASGKAAFAQIKADLLSMCVGVELCNYCENNEATDVEHIFPKSSFPSLAFEWDNYLLACKICNTTYKGDGFAVFDPAALNTVHELTPQLRPRTTPPTIDSAFINLRDSAEDPLHLLWLDIQGRTYGFAEHPALTSARDKAKAAYTLRLLQLNDRPPLLAARKAAFQFFRERLERCGEAVAAADFDDLARLVKKLEPDHERVDRTKPLAQEKARVLAAIRRDIQTHSHPTVWAEMKRQRADLPNIDNFFRAAPPEALSW
ncbi:hypothetical protein BEN47_09975 [Hymenobacter lapidarius]|uniref:HNH domain-containing protein n=1 Tax=Hymenobacter lapidarius TaxID=1908237 RepID=A0A1G1TB34_9BACT|nr:HNH endonuclease [Hymenobacter lapidarius]OGX88065.1 hypothetical protein BEN47_09975 [Hymenobacter lapidarius]